jgi:hypothetical protein
MLMQVKLKVRGLWIAVDKGGVDPQEDIMVLGALVSAVPCGDGGDHGGQEHGKGGMGCHHHHARQ